MSDWRDEPAPTHRCKVCDALWRFWPESDTGHPDSWSLRSSTCGPCCNNVAMGDQITWMTMGDMLALLRARTAVDAMTQYLHGPKPGEEKH